MIPRTTSANQVGRHHLARHWAAGTLGYLAVYAAVSFAWAVFLYSVIRTQ